MNEETIEKLLEALVEDYSCEELEDDAFMFLEMEQLLGMDPREAEAILFGAREIKKLRKYVVPDWKQLLVVH